MLKRIPKLEEGQVPGGEAWAGEGMNVQGTRSVEA